MKPLVTGGRDVQGLALGMAWRSTRRQPCLRGRQGEKSRFDPEPEDLRPHVDISSLPSLSGEPQTAELNDLGISVVSDKNTRKLVINYVIKNPLETVYARQTPGGNVYGGHENVLLRNEFQGH